MTRERLLVSIALAVVIHAAAFLLLELFLKLRRETMPEYSGPMFVQLEEQPVIQQARESAALPAQLEASAAQGREAPPATSLQPAAPRAASGLAAARSPGPSVEEPLKPKGPQFRMEGAPAQEAEVRPGPSGKGFQIPSEEPTLPPSGGPSKGAPLRAEAVSPQGPSGEAPALPLESVDKALAQTGGAKAGRAGAVAGGVSTAAPGRTGAGVGEISREGISILWDDPSQGREPTSTPKPVIPAWVSQAGLRLTMEVGFVLTPQGVLHSVRVVKSSGYSDVDSSVLEALRRWKFKSVASRANVTGRVGYLILPR
jgi:TonB family protein